MYYLAYGSNMAAARLQQRIPSARPLGVVTLTGHRLTFDNASTKDGSGKCDALLTDDPADKVFAVLYRFDPLEKPVLDGYEGVGVEYRDAFVAVEAPNGDVIKALIYYGTNPNPLLKPFHWYKEHVLRGALENALPDEYVSAIKSVAAVDDADEQRVQRELAIYRK
ncbi:AIG2-like family protein [Malonomonas rubra DSM 5091]|uniref:AIG2-like family protein n=1 Tax=Malonomonas rubra DSM 5091 TaxID=1122189 RepID=A0A1M6C3L7_MALRU|nr:gamma-glutamylcyclotransferase family protein [Malonomonas rubra]SHI55542.1 AIG2-like family protein [Malonomonas rubra DSM 5091]